MVNKIYVKTPVITNRIHPEFTGNELTNYAGLVPFADFLLRKLSFRQALAEQLDLGMGPNCSYAGKLTYHTRRWTLKMLIKGKSPIYHSPFIWVV